MAIAHALASKEKPVLISHIEKTLNANKKFSLSSMAGGRELDV
jgi:hypothetical protein